MTYLWIKALHVSCVLIWMGGMLLLAIAGAALHSSLHALLPYERKLALALLAWDRKISVPAMFGAWVFGIALVSLGSWVGAFWLTIKLGIVIVLSAVHGVLAVSLRQRFTQPENKPPAFVIYAPAIVAVCVVFIAMLVILKPSFPASVVAFIAPALR